MAPRRERLAREAAARGKYAPPYRRLAAMDGPRWRVSFGEIEAILGFDLPASACLHRPWWANRNGGGGHGHALAWQAAGWKTGQVDLEAETLVFERPDDVPARAGRAGSRGALERNAAGAAWRGAVGKRQPGRSRRQRSSNGSIRPEALRGGEARCRGVTYRLHSWRNCTGRPNSDGSGNEPEADRREVDIRLCLGHPHNFEHLHGGQRVRP